jgi:SulP family sulfate permease
MERCPKALPLPWPLAPIRFPIVEWLPKYDKPKAVADVIAGLTVFVFLVPQGMAYALLAGMPTIYGLYTSIVPLYIYAVFGTSQQLSMGPMAITSLLLGVAAARSGYEEASHDYIAYALNVSLVVGVLVLLLGIFRLGTLANLISPSVLTGFLTASALVISLNQVSPSLSLSTPPLSLLCPFSLPLSLL